MSLSLIEELELQVIALRGNDLDHCAGLVQQAIAALKAQPGGVVLPERMTVETAGRIGMSESVNRSGAQYACDWYNRALDEVARLNSSPVSAGEPFQLRVLPWLLECFGAEIANDTVERNHRFLEEALELVQACGCPADEAHKLVDYVYGRPVGEKSQEVGGVMVTLAALCLAQGLDMHLAGETELARITQPAMVERIREKQKRKPAMSPLPGVYPERAAVSAGGVDERAAFEAWHNRAYGPQDKYNPIRSLAYDSAGVGLGYDDTTVMAQFHAFKGALALSAPSHGEQVRDGWKLVPVEPTPEMISAAEEAHMPFGDMDIALRCALLAAPSPASQKEQGE